VTRRLLVAAIESWRGGSVSELKEIEQEFQSCAGYTRFLLECMDVSHLEVGATWLLKSHVESGGLLNAEKRQGMVRRLPCLTSWQSKLHLLQVLSVMDTPRGMSAILGEFIRGCITDENRFVRAWACSAICHLAEQDEDYSREAEDVLVLAESDDSAAVRARVRQLKRKR